MATIAYALSGDGRGHAARARVMTQALRERHRVIVFAPGDAYDLLAPTADGDSLAVRRHPALRFGYGRTGRPSILATLCGTAAYLAALPGLVRRRASELVHEGVDLVIADFEASLPRAAHLADIPTVSLDHQYYLAAGDLRELPAHLRRWAATASLVVRWMCPRAARRVVSSFYRMRLKPGFRRVTRIGVLLRRRLLEAVPWNGAHVVAYVRRIAPAALLDSLAACGREVRVYGLGARPREGRLRFLPVSEDGFLTDLAGCAAVVTTAGNQLVGEALHLGKPVLALPESGNREQEINAHYLQASGAGLQADPVRVAPDALRSFLARAENLPIDSDRLEPAGNRQALAAVERELKRSATAVARTMQRPPATHNRRHAVMAGRSLGAERPV